MVARRPPRAAATQSGSARSASLVQPDTGSSREAPGRTTALPVTPLTSGHAPVNSVACPEAVLAGRDVIEPRAVLPSARNAASAGMRPRAVASAITPAAAPSRLARISRGRPFGGGEDWRPDRTPP